MELLPRHLEASLAAALDTSRVVVLHGARQAGKTTLARALATSRGGSYVTLDNAQMLDAARADPHSFVRSFAAPLVIDEFQLAGDALVRALKVAVDESNERGRFLLTGSTNFLTVPTISESLAGRVRIKRLWPLSQSELAGATAAGATIRRWFDGDHTPWGSSSTTRGDYLAMLCRGGYPEVHRLAQPDCADWFESYVETVINRDVLEVGDLRRPALMGQILSLAAAGTARESNVSDWAQKLGASRATVSAYLAWLNTVFLVQELPAWTRNRVARAVRRPKLHLTDSGLAAALASVDAVSLTTPTSVMVGPLMETFVVGEINRQLSASRDAFRLHHYRSRHGHEVDLICERADGAVVAVEIKATASPRASDLRHLKSLRDSLDQTDPGAFRAGILLHAGRMATSHGDRLLMLPIDTLWRSPDSS